MISPFIFMEPELVTTFAGRPQGVPDLATSGNDVLGMGALLCFFFMLAATPIITITGWNWISVLRRDFGRATFAIAAFDLTLAALTTASRVPGGLLTRVGGHTFLFFGTLSTLLLLPLALTSTKRAQRWLGKHWKFIHALVYFIWATILIHLAFLFAFRTIFVESLIVSVPLLVMRLGPVERWWRNARRRGDYLVQRTLGIEALLAVFLYGLVPLMSEYLNSSVGAFVLHPPG